MKKFKNLKSLIIILLFSFTLIGCSNNTSSSGNKDIEGTLPEIMESIYSGINKDMNGLINTEINNENITYYLGVKSLEFKEALASEPMINIDPHSVVLVRINDTSKIEDIKSQIKAKVDPRKWICVGVEEENVIVDNLGDIIILIMDNNLSKELLENFKNLSK